MTPVRTDETPGTATAPRVESSGEVLQQIETLPFGVEYTEFREGTFSTLVTFWRPDEGELEALMAGGAVKVSLIGVGYIPPHKVEVVSFEKPAPAG